MATKPHLLYFSILLMGFLYCNVPEATNKEEYLKWDSMVVTATAYNSVEGQTQGNPRITAWGDTLRPGMKSIAISRDLLKKGLEPGMKIHIEGLDGFYTINDKMHGRWKNKIDIYMGTKRKKALNWGKRRVEICFDKSSKKGNIQ